MTYAAWLLSTEARGYETKNQRHSSRALPAQHDASLASPRELGAIPLQALAIDFCTSGGKTDPLCSSPRCMGQGAPMPNCSHFVTGSCQLTPNATRSSRVSREPRVWGMVVGRGCPRGAGELGAPSECAAAAAPAGLARLVLGAGPRPGRAWLRAQGRDVLPGQSTAQGRHRAQPPAGRFLLSFSPRSRTGRKAGKRQVLVGAGDADSGRDRSRTAPLSSAGGSAASADWPRWC